MKKTTKKKSSITNKKINTLIENINTDNDGLMVEDIVYNFLKSADIENINTKNTKEKIAQTLIDLAQQGDIKAIKEILLLEQKAAIKKKEKKEYLVNIEFTSVSDENEENIDDDKK